MYYTYMHSNKKAHLIASRYVRVWFLIRWVKLGHIEHDKDIYVVLEAERRNTKEEKKKKKSLRTALNLGFGLGAGAGCWFNAFFVNQPDNLAFSLFSIQFISRDYQ